MKTTICGLLTTKAFRHGETEFSGPGEVFDSVALGVGAVEIGRLMAARYITIGAIATVDLETEAVELLPAIAEQLFPVEPEPSAEAKDDPPSEPIAVTEKGGGWYTFTVEGKEEKVQGEDELFAFFAEHNLEFEIIENQGDK